LNKGYESSPITDKLLGISTMFPIARSVVVTGTAETFPDITYSPLVKTDDGAWGETDLNSMSSAAGPTLGEGDDPGPLYLAAAAENRTDKSRMVVFGDADFVSDAKFANQSLYNLGANANLFVNSVNWATTEENLLNLTLKTPTSRSLQVVDNVTVVVIGLITVIGMPVLVLVLGGVMWFQRRRHT
jgi:ABC-2 type transport system permease protein